jgi:hypothetical protein
MVLERIQPLGQKPRPQPLPMTLMQRFHPLRLSVIARDVLEGKRERVYSPRLTILP